MALLGGCATAATLPGAGHNAADAWSRTPSSCRTGRGCRIASGCRTATPEAVVLALHGMNDSRDAWEIPAPDFAAAGIAVYSPDQRGFGGPPDRGCGPARTALVDDAGDMARLLRRRYPGARLILMGESMGAAVLMCLATAPTRPQVDGYVLVAPAVWGRARDECVPARQPVAVRRRWCRACRSPARRRSSRCAASDNREALIRAVERPADHPRHAGRHAARPGGPDGRGAGRGAAVSPRRRCSCMAARTSWCPNQATAATWRALPRGAAGAGLLPGAATTC